MSWFSRPAIIIVLVLAVLGVTVFVLTDKEEPAPIVEVKPDWTKEVIGTSVENRPIESYTYHEGEAKHLVFVGGVHGGYEWNSVLLAEEVITYLKANTDQIPANLRVTVIPNLNPDGVEKSAAGRFNANNVDLNRNFDCKWQPESTWKNKKVSAGTAAFSEPEAKALRDFVLKNKSAIQAVVFWHSQGDAVYASECEGGILPVTLDLMNLYSKASGYKAIEKFESYAITGDAEGWLASIGIPAITVELKTHTDLDLTQNLAGVKALLRHFGQE